MLSHLLCGSLIIISLHGTAQSMTSGQLFQKTINYHDPENQWPLLQQQLFFETDMPDGTIRNSQVKINNTTGLFEYANAERSFGIKMDSCYQISGEAQACERIARTRNYYVYLWGLPMKLMDAGTDMDKKVYTETLNDKSYQVLKVTYPDDVWYFYINPETFALEAYKFYKDEPNQKGEIIYLQDEMVVQQMKIPASRAWYRTENDEYLATDRLIRVAPL